MPRRVRSAAQGAAQIGAQIGAQTEAQAKGRRYPDIARAIAGVVRTSVMHPVILPIIAGFVWSFAGLRLPGPIDTTLALLGSAAPVLCLILLGATLTRFDRGADLGLALRLAAFKSLAHPLAVYAVGRWVFALEPLALAVLTVVASLPIGANVFLLAQRYRSAETVVSAGVALSTLATAITIGPLLALLEYLAR